MNEEVKGVQEEQDSAGADLQTESEKVAKEMRINASNISKADILDMVAEVKNAAEAVVHDLYDVKTGCSFEKAVESLNLYAEILKNGKHRAFTRRNDWLDDPSYRKDFLSKETKDQSKQDRETVVMFYDMSVYATKLFDAFAKYVHFINNEVVPRAYYLIRYEQTLSKAYSAEDYNRIKLALAEYDTIFRRYNNSSILEEMDVSKDYTFEENYEAVLDHMDNALVTSNNLGAFLMNTKKPQMWEKNRLHCLDRETKEFQKFLEKEDKFRRAYEEAIELGNQEGMVYTVYTGKLCISFFGGIGSVTNSLVEILKTVMDIMKQFKENTTEMPYALLHYDSVVVKVVKNYLAMSLENPLNNGTRYDDIAEGLLVRCRELAKTVAKSAAKWAPQ